jgi:hypothetical protein
MQSRDEIQRATDASCRAGDFPGRLSVGVRLRGKGMADVQAGMGSRTRGNDRWGTREGNDGQGTHRGTPFDRTRFPLDWRLPHSML